MNVGNSEIFCQILRDIPTVRVSISETVSSTIASELACAHKAAVLPTSESSSLQ